ncbi:hypothetical protein M0804_012505 [Polistes exclamans]|nr:hypothetical protein M0804_012505 [Polistes exclamans]
MSDAMRIGSHRSETIISECFEYARYIAGPVPSTITITISITITSTITNTDDGVHRADRFLLNAEFGSN